MNPHPTTTLHRAHLSLTATKNENAFQASGYKSKTFTIVLLTSSLLLLSSVASSVSCAKTSVRNFSSSCDTRKTRLGHQNSEGKNPKQKREMQTHQNQQQFLLEFFLNITTTVAYTEKPWLHFSFHYTESLHFNSLNNHKISWAALCIKTVIGRWSYFSHNGAISIIYQYLRVVNILKYSEHRHSGICQSNLSQWQDSEKWAIAKPPHLQHTDNLHFVEEDEGGERG